MMEKGWKCGHLLSIIMSPKKVVVKSELVKVEHAQLSPQQRRRRIQKTLSEAVTASAV
jgi:predicted component of type VI protein secretion system